MESGLCSSTRYGQLPAAPGSTLSIHYKDIPSNYTRSSFCCKEFPPRRNQSHNSSMQPHTLEAAPHNITKMSQPNSTHGASVTPLTDSAANPGPLDCSICKEPFDHQHRPIMVQACRHVFGADCLIQWVGSHHAMNDKCPICRGAIDGPGGIVHMNGGFLNVNLGQDFAPPVLDRVHAIANTSTNVNQSALVQ